MRQRVGLGLVGGACAVAIIGALTGGTLAGQGGGTPAVGMDILIPAIAPAVFTATDLNGDGGLTRAELRQAFEQWRVAAAGPAGGAVRAEQLAPALDVAIVQQLIQPPGRQNDTPTPATLRAMMAALPSQAPARPAQPRKVLVLGKAAGFVHASIPLAARTIDALGAKTGAWTTTISYDAADVTTDNLRQYDAIFLASTTGCFLDAPGDPAATAARRAALLAFVRGGKGLAGIHAATDSYHSPCPNDPGQPPPAAGAARGGGGGGFGLDRILASQILQQGDANHDGQLTSAELATVADTWFDAVDTAKAGRVTKVGFSQHFVSAFASAAPLLAAAPAGRGAAPAVARGSGPQPVGTWPEFNHLIGGFFKFHWLYPQEITVKIDDPSSPLTAMFHGKPFVIHDETYTFAQDSFSRSNVHVLTSIDYSKMSAADKALEPAATARTDGDYGLSWIRREGQGRVFYEAHGHDEEIYAQTPMLEHLLAGMACVLGDLKADDRPTAAPR